MLFGTPIDNDQRFFGGTVLAIDNNRNVCKIYTDFKQTLDSVPWMSSDRPEFNDKVLVTTVLGSPVILGVLDRIGVPPNYAPDVDLGTVTETGNFSSLTRELVNDPDKPRDVLNGDKIYSNNLGGIFGLLRGGSFIARASKLSQILLSKYDDLVRIVGRNFELFTDSCIEVVASVRGRIYKFDGYSDTLANSRSDVYKYQEHYGDTALANSLKWSYYGLDPVSFAALPVADDIIRKYLIIGTPSNLFQQDLHLTGEQYTIVQNAAGTAYTYIDQTNATFDVKTLNGTFTRITTTPTNVTITYNGSNTVVIDTTGITATHGSSNNKIILDSTKAQLSYNNGTNTVAAVSTGVELLYNGGAHFIRATSVGITMG